MDKITNLYDTFKTKISKYRIEQNHWQAFKDGTTIKQLKAGTCMIKAGDPVKHAYFCITGLFRLFYLLPDGREEGSTTWLLRWKMILLLLMQV